MRELLLLFGIACTTFAFFVRFRMLHSSSNALCVGFWVALISSILIAEYYILVPGFVCNAAAMIANNGKMPVFNAPETMTIEGRHIRGRADHRLQLLCDRFGGFSIGDFLIFGGLFLLLGRVIAKLV